MPVVTIRCITYNHAKFIRDAIEGFLMQETTFPVEILIHDDASTDGTEDIIREYEAKYPQLFRTVFQTENQWSKGREAWGRVREQFCALARGEFIALCEGDDYWTDKTKLQRQFEILYKRSDISIVSHFTKWIDESGNFIREDWGRAGSNKGELREYGEQDVLQFAFAHPNTWLVRKKAFSPEFRNYLAKLPFGDDPLCFYYLYGGAKAVSIGEIWSVYRQHGGGVWSSIGDFKRVAQELVYLVSQRSFYGPQYAKEYDRWIASKRGVLAGMIYPLVRKLHFVEVRNMLAYLAKYRSRHFHPLREKLLLLGVCLRTLGENVKKRIKRLS